MKIFIKNMVCNRCKMAVKLVFEKLGIEPLQVELGEVEITEDSIENIKNELRNNLEDLGFYLIDDKKSQTIEKIKTLIVALVHQHQNDIAVNLSDYLVGELGQDYSKLSNLFSEVEGITIERYFILQKIEKVKELIMYGELTLSQIAFSLNYSSVAHLSNQFKKVTGFNPSYFKSLKEKKRKQLDEI
jgi:AraC-like DNA-binding protein